MKALVASVLFVLPGIAPSLAGPPSDDQAVVGAVRQVERDMGDAMVAVDIGMLNRIYADDFAGIGMSGKAYDKEDLLADFRSGGHRLVSYENGPMDVQVIGDVAAVHGSVTEKRFDHGTETSGEFIWMDLLRKRDGRWVVVRSAAARVK